MREELNELHICLEALGKRIYKLQYICYEKLKECYGDEEIILPINIQKVAEGLGAKIEYGSLNIGASRKVDQSIAQLTYENIDNEVKYKIIVDQSENGNGKLNNLEKYAVAYELGKIIFDEGNNHSVEEINRLNMLSDPYSLPLLSAKLEDFEYEMCAIFLLLPMKQFLHEFERYLDNAKEHPVMMNKWIKYLSSVTKIPDYQLINGYQYIKYCAYQYSVEELSTDDGEKYDYRGLFS